MFFIGMLGRMAAGMGMRAMLNRGFRNRTAKWFMYRHGASKVQATAVLTVADMIRRQKSRNRKIYNRYWR